MRNERFNQGLVSMALSVIMLMVGAMALRVYPLETQYVFWLFLFGASLFLADAAVTMTRMPSGDAAAEAARDAAANPWRVAFAVGFILTLMAAARTGSSHVTISAMLMSVIAAGIYLVRRRFFSNLRDLFKMQTRPDSFRAALKARDHETLVKLIEARIEGEKDVSRKNALLLSLGAVHVVRGEYDLAVRAFERIDRRSQVDEGKTLDMGFVVDLNVASAYVAKGDFESAETVLERVDAGTLPEEFRVAYDINKSSLLVGKGAHAEAIRFLESLKLAEIPPKSRFPFLRDLAESLAASGSDPARAMKVAEECLAIETGPQSLNVMAFVLIAEKKFDDAIARLLTSLKLNPDGSMNLRVFAETLYYLGICSEATGSREEAKSWLAQATRVKGGGRFSTAAEALLAKHGV